MVLGTRFLDVIRRVVYGNISCVALEMAAHVVHASALLAADGAVEESCGRVDGPHVLWQPALVREARTTDGAREGLTGVVPTLVCLAAGPSLERLGADPALERLVIAVGELVRVQRCHQLHKNKQEKKKMVES